jgi:NTE family protein
VVVESVEITGVSRVSPKLVARRMQTKPGDTLDLEVLKEDLQRLYQIGEFEQVGFELTGGEEHYRLVIRAREKSWGPWYVRLGAALEANLKGRGRFTAVGMLRRPQINRLGAEWKSWLTFGSFMALDTEFYQPVEYTGTIFVAPRALLLKSQDEYRYEGDERIPVEVDRKSALFDVGLSFGALGELRLGAYKGSVTSTDDTTEPTRIEEDLGGFHARFEIDQIDDANFPRRGTWALANVISSRDWMDATRDYDRLLFEIGHAAPIGRTTVLGTARVGTDLGTGLPFYDDFVLGGLFNLSGLEIRDLQGSKLGFLRLMVYREVGEMPGLLGGDFYLGGSLEYGNAWPAGVSPEWDDGIPAGSLFAGVDTILGAFYVGYGLAEGGEQTIYILLGRPLVRR